MCVLQFPFNARHKHSPDYCRDFLHLRPKTDSFASLLRVRSAAAAAFHSYFQVIVVLSFVCSQCRMCVEGKELSRNVAFETKVYARERSPQKFR